MDATTDSTSANGSTLKDSVVNNAASAVNAAKNSELAQSLSNGPVATSVKNQTSAAKTELGDLAGARTQPSHTAANETPLTHYHSFFYTLLSWEHPRATAISFATTVLFIFGCRYLPILRIAFKMTYMTLGVVALAEVVTKFVMGSGVASSVRPRRYYKIPRESLEAFLEDLEQLINFFVIEFQRILFAENVPVTTAAFAAAFISYYLIKILPLWGMTLLTTCILYLAPLVYVQNKEFIDEHITHAHQVIHEQAAQVKDLTAQHTSKGLESVKAYTGDYAAKATELVGSARQKIPLPATSKTEPVRAADFPNAPSGEVPSTAAADTGKTGEPVPAS